MREDSRSRETCYLLALSHLLRHLYRRARRCGVVLAVDHFGNIVTSFSSSMLPTGGEIFLLRAGKAEVTLSTRTYHQGSKDKTFCIVGSSGYIEISLREGSAAAQHEIAVGDSVELSLSPRPEQTH